MKLSGLYRVRRDFLDYIEPWVEDGYYGALIEEHEAQNRPVYHPDDEEAKYVAAIIEGRRGYP